MSYEPTVWAAGDVVTATKMNKIEQGISENSGGGNTGLVVNMEEEDGAYILSERFSTIADCIESGGIVYVHGTETVEKSGEGGTSLRSGSEAEIDFYVPVQTLTDSESGIYAIAIGIYSIGNYNFVAATREDYPTDSSGSDSQPHRR